jgi:hypothetical protein
LNTTLTTTLSAIFLGFSFISSKAAENSASILDSSGALGAVEAPVSIETRLSPDQIKDANSGRLGWLETGANVRGAEVAPVQWEIQPAGVARATWMLPPGKAGARSGVWRAIPGRFAEKMEAVEDDDGGQVELKQDGKPILRYNYRTVEPGELVNQVSEGNRIYAKPRSNYIHPLHGINGEVLTRDWPLDHPHHRGIYWAWPEVDYGSQRGDLHALQRVFARPTGPLKLTSGPVFAQVAAENLWMWEDNEPIARERIVIRAYEATARGRAVDLHFEFLALKEGVTIARRGTDAYGGLNIRLATPQSQSIKTHTDAPGASPRRAWSDIGGVFGGAPQSGLVLLQCRSNPGYPGDWVQYPEIAWVQPTFPASGIRHQLSRELPLVLRYRLFTRAGAPLDEAWAASLWDALQMGSDLNI